MPGNPLDLHAARPAELQARIAAERLGEPFLVYRDAADAPGDRRASARGASG